MTDRGLGLEGSTLPISITIEIGSFLPTQQAALEMSQDMNLRHLDQF
jgi:hypothetical protein